MNQYDKSKSNEDFEIGKDIKNEDTKYCFAQAIKKLMKRESLEEITVKQISDESGFSRQTFYRNFLDKYDLINWYFDKLLHISFDQMGSGKTVYDGLVLKFNYIKKERVFFSVAFESDEQNNLKEHDFLMIYDFYINMLTKKNEEIPDENLKMLLEMYCWSSIYMTVKWVLDGMKMSPENLALLMIDAMMPKLYEAFEKTGLLK